MKLEIKVLNFRKKHNGLLSKLEGLDKKELNEMIGYELNDSHFRLRTDEVLKSLNNTPYGIRSNIIVNSELPELHYDLSDIKSLTNETYLQILSFYKNNKLGIPVEEGFECEKEFAIYLTNILQHIKDINDIHYEVKRNNVMLKMLLSQQEHCFCCGKKMESNEISIEHLQARSNTEDLAIQSKDLHTFCNLAKMCIDCNAKKADKSLLEFYYLQEGFKFYPLNVLIILHLEKRYLIENGVGEAEEIINAYKEHFPNYIGLIAKISMMLEKYNILKSEFNKIIN